VITGSRVFFALARDGLLPPLLSRTSRRDTPLGGNLVILAAGTAALLAAGFTTYGDKIKAPNNITFFQLTAGAGSLLIEAVYAILAVAALWLIWNMGGGMSRLWRMVVATAGLATPVLAYYGTLHPYPPFPFDRQVTFAAISVGLVAVWLLYLRLAHPERMRAAAAHARVHHGVPPLDEELDYTPAEEPHGRPAIPN
jgi:amino acid transporter